jgi:hypothetical protein
MVERSDSGKGESAPTTPLALRNELEEAANGLSYMSESGRAYAGGVSQ